MLKVEDQYQRGGSGYSETTNTSMNSIGTVGSVALGTILAFMFIYNISFQAMPSLSTGRLVLLLTVLLANLSLVFSEFRGMLKKYYGLIGVLLLLLVHAVITYILGVEKDFTQLSRIIHFFLFSLLGMCLFTVVLKKNLQLFLASLTLATLFQAVFIFYSFWSLDFRIMVSNLLVQGGHISLTSGSRPPGFSNSSGAALSVIQALGVYASLYAAHLSRGVAVYLFQIAGVVVAISTLFTGRTGLLMVVIFVLAFVFRAGRRQFIAFLCIGLVLWGSAAMTGELVHNLFEGNPTLYWISDWAFEFFYAGQVESLTTLSNQIIPPLSMETILGTGAVFTLHGVNASGHDSGYIQNYYASGVLLAGVFYIGLLWTTLTRSWRSTERVLTVVLVLTMFAVELKEPFIFKYVYPFFLFSMLRLQAVSHDGVRR